MNLFSKRGRGMFFWFGLFVALCLFTNGIALILGVTIEIPDFVNLDWYSLHRTP